MSRLNSPFVRTVLHPKLRALSRPAVSECCPNATILIPGSLEWSWAKTSVQILESPSRSTNTNSGRFSLNTDQNSALELAYRVLSPAPCAAFMMWGMNIRFCPSNTTVSSSTNYNSIQYRVEIRDVGNDRLKFGSNVVATMCEHSMIRETNLDRSG